MTAAVTVLETPLGNLAVELEGEAVASLRFTQDTPTALAPAAAEVARQIKAYFAGDLKEFTLPLSPAGTPFQLAVWTELRRIPYGETRSYGQIAAALGRPGASRAVGTACGANPLLIVTPCHRVVRGDGALGGFAAGLERKKALLALEKKGR